MLRVVFMGSPAFAVPALRALTARHEVALVVTRPDKPAGRGKRLTPPPVKQAAAAAGLAVIQPRSGRAPELAGELAATGADVAVVVAYGVILPRAVLEAFPHGCINIHASLLPAYRGAAPIQRAIINGESQTGVTIMQLDEGMDTGPMLRKRAVAIAPDDTAGTLAEKLAPVGAELLIETLADLEAGRLRATAQDSAAATYAPMLNKEDGVIDWTQPARRVCDRIRGVDPWPGAATSLAGEPLKLFAASPAERAPRPAGAPGEIVSAGAGGLVVACGEGACAIGEVQPPGKRRMPAAAFCRGRHIEPGAVLGAGA